MIPRDVVLIGVPTNSSGTAEGVARAPGALRQRGLTAALAGRPGFTDAGDLALAAPQARRGPSGLLAEDALIVMIGQVRDAVRAAREGGRFPLLIGGDCPVILGALAALQAEAGEPGLLFVDGHEDAWPPRSSPTGEAADCELGLALRLFDGDLAPGLRAVLRAAECRRPGPGGDGAAGQLRAGSSSASPHSPAATVPSGRRRGDRRPVRATAAPAMATPVITPSAGR
jgi:arginase